MGRIIKFDKETIAKFKEFQNSLHQNNTNSSEKAILFFSFDVVNSTRFKELNPLGWADILLNLFSKINEKVANAIENAELWRVLGDEAIYIVEICSKESLYTTFSLIDQTFNNLLDLIKNGELFCDFNISSLNLISLKSTVWIALVSEFLECNSSEKPINNLFKKYEFGKSRFYEFLGNDIDAGFRIAEYSSDGYMTLSFELAYLLSDCKDFFGNINIIAYKRLKGIWADKLYPIIWYYNPQFHNNTLFKDSFKFDDSIENELIKDYLTNINNNATNGIKPEMYTDTQNALGKILKDRFLSNKLKKISDCISKSKEHHNILIDPQLELHCATICFSSDKTQALIAKRSSSRNYAGRWEFGCVAADSHSSLEESIKDQYKKDFNIDIQVIINDNRTDVQPYPLAVFSIEKESLLHKGVLTVAIIENDSFDPAQYKSNSNYDEIRWISESEIDDFILNNNTVEDFKESLISAFEYIKSPKIKDSPQ